MAAESPTHDLAQTVQEISERASLLVREEIELAKAEVTEKVTKLLRGIVIGLAAGFFVSIGLLFLLHGMAWLAWYVLPTGNNLSFFWGFFVVAGLLFLLGGVAGYLAAKFFKQSTPPVPTMAIDEAGKIKRTFMRKKRKKPLVPARTPEQIRASIEANRKELGTSRGELHAEIAVLTDWRGQLVKHQKNAVIGAAVAGFVIGGGIAAFGGLFRRKR